MVEKSEKRAIEKKVKGIGFVDATLAMPLKQINDAGFKSTQSHSGLKKDHHEHPQYPTSGYVGGRDTGYITFLRSNLTPEKEEKIVKAAKLANLSVEYDDIFFFPAITVRTNRMKSGKSSSNVLRQASVEAGLKVSSPDFMEKLEIRNKIYEQRFKENDGYLLDTDEKAQNAFNTFSRALVKPKSTTIRREPSIRSKMVRITPKTPRLSR